MTRGFQAERAALFFLNGMDPAVAPRLLGAVDHLLITEDLGPALSLADALLGPDPRQAAADLTAYARAYGALHAWSARRRDEFAAACAGLGSVPEPHWLAFIDRGRESLLAVAARLGLPFAGVRAEVDSLGAPARPRLALHRPGSQTSRPPAGDRSRSTPPTCWHRFRAAGASPRCLRLRPRAP